MTAPADMRASIASAASIASIGSSGSVASIGSTGSILSIGATGSIGALGDRRASRPGALSMAAFGAATVGPLAVVVMAGRARRG